MTPDDNQSEESVIQEVRERLPGRWPLLLGYVLAALVIAVVVVYGGRAIYRSHHKPIVKPAPTITKQSSRVNSRGASSALDHNHASGSAELPNNGPGQVVGLFVGTSLVAAGLHYAVRLKKA